MHEVVDMVTKTKQKTNGVPQKENMKAHWAEFRRLQFENEGLMKIVQENGASWRPKAAFRAKALWEAVEGVSNTRMLLQEVQAYNGLHGAKVQGAIALLDKLDTFLAEHARELEDESKATG